jgi:hypothetical protein
LPERDGFAGPSPDRLFKGSPRDSVITDKSNHVHPSVTSVPDLDSIRKIMVLARHAIGEQM